MTDVHSSRPGPPWSANTASRKRITHRIHAREDLGLYPGREGGGVRATAKRVIGREFDVCSQLALATRSPRARHALATRSPRVLDCNTCKKAANVSSYCENIPCRSVELLGFQPWIDLGSHCMATPFRLLPPMAGCSSVHSFQSLNAQTCRSVLPNRMCQTWL